MIEKVAIISGITGQDGSYLAQILINLKYKVIGLTRKVTAKSYFGLDYLNIRHKVELVEIDLLNITEVRNLIEKYNPSEFYNLAAQSSVFLSFKNPIATFEFNTLSVFNLLETIKNTDKQIRFYQASSSEMFGKVNNLPITENSILHPLSPYAISKAAAHFTCIHYRESYNMHINCGVLFNHESYLRENSFFVKKIIKESVAISKGEQKVLYVGNIDVKRDFGYAPSYVEAMYLMLQKDLAGDYLICSGASVSLRELIYYIFKKLNINQSFCQISNDLYRPAEIIDIYGDNTKAKTALNWNYQLSIFDTLDLLLDEEQRNYE